MRSSGVSHVLPAIVILVCGCEWPQTPIGTSQADAQALERQLEQLAFEVEGSEGVRAVKRLQHAYGHYSEFGLWHDFADLFSDEAVGHYTGGPITGRERIREHFLANTGRGILGLAHGRLYPHINLTPVVTLSDDGTKAKGRWRIIAMLGSYGGNATWAGGLYENEYVHEDGAWRISKAQFHGQYSGRYEDGLRPSVRASVPPHFDVRGAAGPLVALRTPPSGYGANIGSAAERLADLERRVRRMAAEIEVANLQHAYGYYVDRKLWDDAADLFADDATFELGRGGIYIGRESIRRAFEQFGPQGLREGELNDHVLLQTVVTVAPDGTTAKARSTQLSMTGRNGEGAEWGQGVYENELVHDDGVWKIRSLRYYPRLVTDYDEGWGRSAKPAPGPSSAFPPDAPPTEIYELYPAFVVPRFHFGHPVTGQPTEYPEDSAVGPADVQALAPAFVQSGSGTTSSSLRAEFDARLQVVRRELAKVRAHDAVENLVNAYAYYLDDADADQLANLFADNGWNEIPGLGVFVGREKIKASVEAERRVRPQGIVEVRNLTQPVILVAADGQSATFRTRLLQVNAEPEDGGSFVAGVFHGRAVKEESGWKLVAMDLDHTWGARYRAGWARVSRAPESAPPSSDVAGEADAPTRGPVSPPFPKIEDLPFNYANPVSGSEPSSPWS